LRYRVVVLVLLTAAIAHAQSDLPVRDFGVTWSRNAPTVSFSAKHLADERLRQELSSGLRKRIVVTVRSYLKGSNAQISIRQFGCDVTRDLWDDDYLVRIGTQTERLDALEQVLDRCLLVAGLFVGETKHYEPHKGKEMYFAVQAEFNPISKKQCTDLIRPTSGDDAIGPITVNIVRRRICRAERTVEFRSQYVRVPE